MAAVNPAPRRRVIPVANAADAAPSRPTIDRHNLFEAYDGPPSLPPTRGETGQLQQQQRTLGERLDLIARADRGEAQTLVLQTLHQYVLARTPPDVICQRMGMSYRALRVWRQKLAQKLRDDSMTRNPHDYLGPMLAETEEIKAQAWREIAAAPAKDWSRRARFIDTIMKANSEIARILQVAGMFDNQPMRQPLPITDESDGGASVLKQMAENFLSGGYASNQEYRKSLRPDDVIVDET